MHLIHLSSLINSQGMRVQLLDRNMSDESSYTAFCTLLEEDEHKFYNNKQKILNEYINDAKKSCPLLAALKNGKLKYFEALLTYGLSPFILDYTKESIDGNRYIRTAFNFLIGKQPDSPYIALCIGRIKEIQSLDQIVELPLTLLEERNILTNEHKDVLRQKIAVAINELNIPSESKDMLKNFLNETDIKIAGYPLLNRISVVTQLVNFIGRPYTQGQLDQDTCGVNVIFISLAMQAPNVLIHIAFRLLADGFCKYPTKLIANEDIKASCDNMAKLFNQSLKNSQQHLSGKYVPYSMAAKWFHDWTLPDDLNHFLEDFGCGNIIDTIKFTAGCVTYTYENFLGYQYGKKTFVNNNKLTLEFSAAIDLLLNQFINQNQRQGKECIIYIKMALIAKFQAQAYNHDTNSIAAIISKVNSDPLRKYLGVHIEHYAVLKDIKYNQHDNSLVDLVIYTYGEEIKVSITRAELESEWLGYISFEFPENLKAATIQELYQKENISSYNNNSLRL